MPDQGEQLSSIGEGNHLKVHRKEGVVGEEAVAAGSGHDVALERGIEFAAALQHCGGSVHQLVHVAAHAIQWQIVRHLRAKPSTSALLVSTLRIRLPVVPYWQLQCSSPSHRTNYHM